MISSCKKEDSSEQIILPSGTEVQYTNSEFLTVSSEFYSVELLKYEKTINEFNPLSNITPKQSLGSNQSVSYILPKDKNTAGVFLIRVNMSREALALESFVLPGQVTKPNMASTLLVELLKKYPNRPLDDYRVETLTAFQTYIDQHIKKTFEKYPTISEFSFSDRYKFIKNSLSTNYEFLELLYDYNVNFTYESTGVVKQSPYPFGKKNIFPQLDLANSTPNNKDVNGIEKNEVTIRGKAIDLDNDQLLYTWKKEGQVVDYKEKTEFKWTPDYNEFRLEPYVVQLIVTDGGPEQTLNWRIKVADLNRRPEVTSNCPKVGKEDVELTCEISAVDHDGQKMKFTFKDTGVNARALINGQKTNDVTRSITYNDVTKIELKFTPSNKDAFLRSAFFQIDVEDESGGMTTYSLPFGLEDVNSAPQMLGNLSTIEANTDHEWDYCAEENPDGGLTPYDFYIQVQDPDNLTETAEGGFDIVSTPTMTGSLACVGEGCVETLTCPGTLVSSPTQQYFCYRWKPAHNKKTGSIFFTFKDDHGGISDIKQVDLVAADRNQKPCVNQINMSTGITLSLDLSNYDFRFSGLDRDLDAPNLSFTLPTGNDILPFLYDSSSLRFPIFRRKLNGSTLGQTFYRTTITNPEIPGGSQNFIQIKYQSPYSGVVKFYRNSIYTNPVTIAKNTILETNTGLFPYLKYKYKTTEAVTMAQDDLEIWVPVEIYDQSVPAGKLNSVKAQTLNGIAVNSAGLTFSNASAISGETGTITITRASTVGALTLPKYLEFFSSDEILPTTSSIRYYNYTPIYFMDGQASVNIPVSSIKTHIKQSLGGVNNHTRVTTFVPFIDENVTSNVMTPQNEMILGSALSDPSIQVSYENLYNYKDFSLNPMNGASTRSLLATAEDTYLLNNGEKLFDQNGDEYTILANLKLFGSVQIERTGSPSNPISSGLTLSRNTTTFKSINGSQYKLNEDLTFASNVTTATAQIERKNHTNPVLANEGRVTVSFSDKNFKPIFIIPSGAATLSVLEGEVVNDYLFEVNDNALNFGSPNDPFDRHSFLFEPTGLSPSGDVLFCREKGDSVTDINSPACTPCTTPIVTDYFDSARCYARFFPKSTLNDPTSDITKEYNYMVTAKDNSSLSFGEPNETKKTLKLSVIEKNDPPVINDSLWNVISSSQISPYTCEGASCGDFVEGNFLQFLIYASDPDRGTTNKALNFSLRNQIYDLKDNVWKTKPSGLTVATYSVVTLNANGGNWGSKYSGRIYWTPTDAEAKTLAGPGFIIQVNVSDNGTPKLTTSAFYKVTIQNVNNPPNLKNAVNLTMVSDTYNSNTSTIVLQDLDYTSIGAPVNFTTSLSLCKSTSTLNCPAPLDGWPDVLKTYDPLYTRNSTVPNCRSGSDLNTQLALPYLTRGNSSISGGRIQYPYKIEWCPQRSHIGTHNVYLQMNDNGDTDRNNLNKLRQDITASMQLKIVAPVFFMSPLKDVTNTVINAPFHAYYNRQYLYQTLTNNSRGNVQRFQLLTYPTGMTFSNNSTVMEVSGTTIGALIKWTPTLAQLSTDDPLTWHTVSLKVTDKVTNEFDIVTYKIQVRSPTTPVQTAPVVDSKSPSLTSVVVDEAVNNVFSITASNTSNPTDQLFYSWFVDNVKKYDEGPSFAYLPSLNDFGKHTIKVEIFDGYFTTTNTWNVEVRNTIPNIINAAAPTLDIFNFNQTKLGKVITNMIWSTETNVETISGSDTYNSIIFSGSYTKDSSHRDFVYNLKLKNGVLATALTANVNPVIGELLPWEASLDTNRIAFKTTPGQLNFKIVLTPKVDRATSFTSSLSNSVCLPNTLNISSYNPVHACNSTDANQLYKSDLSYGELISSSLTVSGSVYDISATKTFDELQWTGTGGTTTFFNSTSLGAGVRVSGIVGSTSTSKIYVTVRDIANSFNKLLIFDASPLSALSNPTLITTLDIHDGVDGDNKVSEVILVKDTINGTPVQKIAMLLPGTGGFALLNDTPATPVSGDILFVGNTGSIGKSPIDLSSSGRKLVYNSGSKLIYGVSKGANQVFTLDLVTNTVKVQPTTVIGGLDAIFSFNNDKSIYGVSRTLGQIFQLK